MSRMNEQTFTEGARKKNISENVCSSTLCLLLKSHLFPSFTHTHTRSLI